MPAPKGNQYAIGNNGGAPSDYSPEIANQILDKIRDGLSLNEICKTEGYPARVTVYRWLDKYDEFRDKYARARQDQMHTWADEIKAVAYDDSRDLQPYKVTRQTKNGSIITEEGTKSDNTGVNRDRLKVDTLKWLMARIAPKDYGDKVLNEHTGPNGQPIVVNVVAKVAAHAITEHSLVQQKIKTSEVTPASYEAIGHASSIQLEQPNTVTITPIESENG